MSSPETDTTVLAAVAVFDEDNYGGLVNALKAQVASEMARAKKFGLRSGAEIKRDFAAGNSQTSCQVDDPAPSHCADANEVGRQAQFRSADLPDDQAEALYAIAKRYVRRAADLLAHFERRVALRYERYGTAMASEIALVTDPGETEAMERVLALLLGSSNQVFDAFDCVLCICEVDIPHVDELAFRLERLIIELGIYARDLPQVIDRAKLHLDSEMLDLGVVIFREAVEA